MIKPLNHNIIVKEEKFKEKTDDGIILTHTTSDDKTKITFGVVVETSDALGELTFCIGSRVAFSPYAGSRLNIDGEDFLVLSFEDLVGYDNG